MSDSHSTASHPGSKPAKPYPEFPLTVHAPGSWCKKIRGKMHYFGPSDDPDAPLAKYLSGRTTRTPGGSPGRDQGMTVKDTANAFLNPRKALLDAGELSSRMWAQYKEVCDLRVKHPGKACLAAE